MTLHCCDEMRWDEMRASPDTDILPRPSHWPRPAPGSTRCPRPSGAAWTSGLRWKFSGRWSGSDSRTVWSKTRLCSPRWSRCSGDGWILLEKFCLRWSEDWGIYLCLTRRLPRGMLRLDWWWSWSSGGRARSTSGWEWLREKRGSLEDKTRVIIRNRACSSITRVFSPNKSGKQKVNGWSGRYRCGCGIYGEVARPNPLLLPHIQTFYLPPGTLTKITNHTAPRTAWLLHIFKSSSKLQGQTQWK